jgi:hypothetical protein
MTDDERSRLTAWSGELRRVHGALRDALAATRQELGAGAAVDRDLLLLCHGFCTALGAHHRGEDRTLFPAIEREHPELASTLQALQQDHSMIGHLLDGLERVVRSAPGPALLEQHLDGIAAIMESHFRYEERRLLAVLDALALDADPVEVLGPL